LPSSTGSVFRDKVCGGWITPTCWTNWPSTRLYARGALQPITGFLTSCIGGPEVETQYGKPISYGIRRYEFDDYLLKRSGATLYEGVQIKQLDRSGGG
jgi:flavin-dependent dehydrogenase